MQWDPEKWDEDFWDSMDSEEIGSPDACVDVKPVLRQELERENGQDIRKDGVEDFTQHEINDIIEKLKQRPGESLLSWSLYA